MLRIGMVGAENSHTAAIARVLNVETRIRGVRATHVWGETRAFARGAAEAGQIEQIVRHPEDMIGQVDAAVVDHRHAKLHLPAAKALLEAKIPLFIDKPFCYRTAAGRRFLDRARELRVPICSYSTVPKQASFRELKKQARRLGDLHAVVSTGACDVKSKWGGVFFYGIHQVDMVLRVLGYDVTHAQVNRGSGQDHTATLSFRSGAIATLNLIGGAPAGFHMSIIGDKGRLDEAMVSDESPYLASTRDFVRMFRTGKTEETDETMLGPIGVLEAMEKSISRKGSKVKVAF